MQVSCLFLFWVHLFFLLNFAFPSLSHPLLTPNNITLYGDAFFRNNGISLTQETTCLPSSSPANIGRALYAYPIRFLDLKNKTTASFSCRFSFSIIPNPLCPFGDGIVFLITSNADSFSFSNGYIGLPQRDLNSQDSFFAVEFDTSFNPSVGDINGNHIGVDVNTVVSFASVDVVSKGVDLKSGKKITAWIEYRDSAKLIQIWVSYSSTKPPSPVLVAQIDLSTQFKEYMHVGFSASNGQGSAMHTVDRWRFKTFRTYRPSVNPIDAIEEGYCFMCSPEDSSTNSPQIYRPHKRSFKMGNMAVALGCLTISVVFVMAIIAVICFFAVRKKRDVGRRGKRIQTRVQMNNVPTRLSLAEIKSATMGFHRNRIVGEGASAVVYKGSLPSAGAVAVKRFDQSNKECGHGTVLVDWVWDLWVRRKLIEAGDCSLSGRYNVLEMERMLKVGLCCVHPNHEKRPTVKEAARILRGEASLPLLPSMRPTVTIRSNLFADSEDILNIGGDHSPSGDDAGWLTPKSHFSKA
ncbi:hypothetical protein QUC31_001149 [Theobroma cacao]